MAIRGEPLPLFPFSFLFFFSFSLFQLGTPGLGDYTDGADFFFSFFVLVFFSVRHRFLLFFVLPRDDSSVVSLLHFPGCRFEKPRV